MTSSVGAPMRAPSARLRRAGTSVNIQLAVESGTFDVLSDVAAISRLGQRPFQDPLLLSKLSTYIDVADARLDRVGGEEATFDDQVRIVLHQVAVLESARLTLVGVTDHVVGPDIFG